MSENIITDRKSALALVKYERDRSKVVYSAYVESNAVTLETVSAHVKALTEIAFPGFVKGDDAEIAAARKAFMNRVRNGLNHTLRKWEADATAKAESAESASTGSETDETGAESADGADGEATSPVAVADASTADLASHAENIIRELVKRALSGDAMAMATLNTVHASIDAAGAVHADVRVAA